MNHSFNQKTTSPSTDARDPNPEDYKKLQKWFTQTFEDIAATATVYKATAPPHPNLPRLPRNQILEVKDEPQIGDRVWHLTQRQIPDRTTKVTHHWTGIFRILEILEDGQIKIDRIQQPGHPVMTTIQNIRPHRQPRPDVKPPAPPRKTDHPRLQMPELPDAPPCNLQPAREVPGFQPLVLTKPPKPWFPTRAKAKRDRRGRRAADPLDWTLAKPVIDMTTKAPDPHQILANQIIKMEGVLHLLNTKSRFQEDHNLASTARRTSSQPDHNLPSLWTLMLFLILILSWKPTHAYTYSYFDCSQPAHLETFDRLALCQQSPAKTVPDQNPMETWMLLQQATSHEVNGTSCEVRRSEFQGYCGVWGHTKLGGAPSVSASVTIDAHECREMLQTRKFVTASTPAGWPIRINEETSFTEMTAGKIWYESDQVRCEGVTVQLNGQVYLDTILMHSYQVIVKTNLLLIHEDHLESLYDRIQLPCAPSTGACVTTHRTYLWQQPNLPCNLAKVKAIQAERVGETHLVSYEDKMLLNLTAEYTNPACGITNGHKTNFDAVIAVRTTNTLNTNHLEARDVNPDWDWAAALGYVEYSLKKQAQDEISGVHRSLCELQFQTRFNTPQRLGEGRYIITRGDSYLTFTCTQKTGRILETKNCFEEVPLAGGIYVDPVTRLASDHGTPTPCSRYFPLIIRTQNVWLELPHLKTRTAPMAKNHGRLPDNTLEDFSPAIIYSKSELAQFYQLLSYPTYKTSRISALLYGDCVHQGTCTNPDLSSDLSSTTFDLNRLSTSLSSLEHSWWSWLVKSMATGGNYLSLVALIIFGLQFSIYLATGFRNSWVWNRILGLQDSIKNLRGVERITSPGETDMFLVPRNPKQPVTDPNEAL